MFTVNRYRFSICFSLSILNGLIRMKFSGEIYKYDHRKFKWIQPVILKWKTKHFGNNELKLLIHTHTHARSYQKITVMFNVHELRMFDFRIFFCLLCHVMSVIYVGNISHFGLSVWGALRFFTIRKNGSMKPVLSFV